jgi:ElaB/YqjD/DUF883 family membrane-anchored ribosome-binding protein
MSASIQVEGEVGMAEDSTATGTATREKLMEDLKAVVNDAEELLKATAHQTGEKIASVRAKAEDSLKTAKARIAEEGKVVMDKAKSAAKSTDEFVHAHPWKAVGIGALAGFVIGLLISRR